jgi:hypothetical protein
MGAMGWYLVAGLAIMRGSTNGVQCVGALQVNNE